MYLRNKESGNVKKRKIQKHKPNNKTTTEISKFEIYDNNTKIKTQKTTKTEMRTFKIKWRLTSKSGIF